MLCWYSFELFWCSFKKLTDWPSKPAQLYSLFNNFTNTACKFATFLPSAGGACSWWLLVRGEWNVRVSGVEGSWAELGCTRSKRFCSSLVLQSSSPPAQSCQDWWLQSLICVGGTGPAVDLQQPCRALAAVECSVGLLATEALTTPLDCSPHHPQPLTTLTNTATNIQTSKHPPLLL